MSDDKKYKGEPVPEDQPPRGDPMIEALRGKAKAMTGPARGAPRDGARPNLDDVIRQRAMTDEDVNVLEAKTFRAADPRTAARGVSPEEPAVVDDDEVEEAPIDPQKDPIGALAQEPRDPNAMPDWLVIPDDPRFKFPPHKTVGFMLFRAPLTDTPQKGDRQIILWGLSDAEEKLAVKRTRGEPARTLSEMAKQMVRAIDGTMADWTGKLGVGNVERFWDEIGPRYRQMVQNFYLKTHSLSKEEQADFFVNCLVVRSSVAG